MPTAVRQNGCRHRTLTLHLRLAVRMQYEFREGDWVLHRSYPDPIRVIGLGSTIAVEFPNGDMQAFEPLELEKVAVAEVPLQKVRVPDHRLDRGHLSDERFALLTSICLICLIALVLMVLASAGPSIL